jgi:hypothetical protein
MKMNLTGHVRVTAVVLLGAIVGGCSSPVHYDLVIKPQGQAFTRTLTVEHASAELVAQLVTIYDQQQPAEGDARARFVKQFTAIPQDIEGTGTWLNMDTPMGLLYASVERFGATTILSSRWKCVSPLRII